MRLRSPVGDSDPGSTGTTDRSQRDSVSDASASSASRAAARTFLLAAAGAVAVAYAVSRVVDSSDDAAVDVPLETVRNRTAAAVPDEVGEMVADAVPAEPSSIPIGGRGSDESEADAGDESDGDDVIDDEEMNADLADEPSSTKISTGSSEEIQDEPAEPGEMAVEDDVEELVDEASGDESDGDDEE